MPRQGKAWTVQDRQGDRVYLTWERWEHILLHHPDMSPFLEEIRRTVQEARRRQDALSPYKYFYRLVYDYLTEGFEVVVVVVAVNPTTQDRFVLTAYLDYDS